MIKFLLPLLAAGAIAMPIAHADDDEFLTDLSEAGFSGADQSSYLSGGHQICTWLAKGYSKQTIATQIYENAKFKEEADAMQLVNIAHRDLCPGIST